MTETNGAIVRANTAPMTNLGASSIAAFASAGNFEAAQRMAKALASSALVPKEYQGNLPNCLIALEVASRVGASVFAVCQNLDIIHGRPSWRAQFLIATVNSCGRFSPLRFREIGERPKDAWGFIAYATDRETGEVCEGPEVTMEIAKAEKWTERNGNKYRTIPHLMLRYRAASWWARLYAPELSLGMRTAEEEEDIHGPRTVQLHSDGTATAIPERGNPDDLKAQLLGERPVTPEAPSSAPDVEAELVTKGSLKDTLERSVEDVKGRRKAAESTPQDADSPPPDSYRSES